MYVLISPAKTFDLKLRPKSDQLVTEPMFAPDSLPIVEAALMLDSATMARELSLSPKLVSEARGHWRRFVSGESICARSAELYSGMVFKKLGACTFSEADWAYAETHLGICSFVYGLLRPADGIRPYRMEGGLRLESGERIFDYWRDRLTPVLIERIQASGGTLAYLASEEMKQLFHWGEVEAAVRVIYPNFLTRQADGSLKQIVIYTKIARGLMARAILTSRLTRAEELQLLTPADFVYTPTESEGDSWTFIL